MQAQNSGLANPLKNYEIIFCDTEPYNVPDVSEGEPGPYIRQICFYSPARQPDDQFFERYVRAPNHLRKRLSDAQTSNGNLKIHKWKKVEKDSKKWINKNQNGNRKTLIVAHNAYKIEKKTLEKGFKNVNDTIPSWWIFFCSLYLSRSLRLSECSLAALCQTYNVEHLPQHNARNDVIMLANVFAKMTQSVPIKKLAKAMSLPPHEHPIRAVRMLIEQSQQALNIKPVQQIASKVQKAVLVFIDFEGTGLFPKPGEPGENPRATELAAYIPSLNKSFSSLIDPGFNEGIELPDEVVELTRITKKMILDAAEKYKQKTGGTLNFKTVWLNFKKFVNEAIKPDGNTVPVYVGHNVIGKEGYEERMIKSEKERFGMRAEMMKFIDSLWLSRTAYAGHKPKNRKGFLKLQELRKRMNIPENNAHRALGDVLVNNEVWKCFVDGIPSDMLNEALFSKHPYINIANLIKKYGTFKPENYMTVPAANAPAPAAPAPARLPEVGAKRSREVMEVDESRRPDIPPSKISKVERSDQMEWTVTFTIRNIPTSGRTDIRPMITAHQEEGTTTMTDSRAFARQEPQPSPSQETTAATSEKVILSYED